MTHPLSESQVAILCGGRGRRLKPATDQIPKALVPLNGRPILDHVVDFYRSRGVQRFVLCIGYKGEMVRDHFSESPEGAEIEFSDAGEGTGMLNRIWELRESMPERMFVSYCDTFIDLDVEGMLKAHTESDAWLTIVTARIRNPFGLVEVGPDGRVMSFREKPLLNYYIGSFIIDRRALDIVREDMLEKPDGQGLVELFETLAGDGRLHSFEHKGLQITFNTESERRAAEEDLGHFYTYREDE